MNEVTSVMMTAL